MSKEILLKEIEQDVEAIDIEFRPRWNRFKIDPVQFDCIRSKEYGSEKIYIVAKADDEVILYDDVEEEFGIGTIGNDGIIRNWEIYAGIDSCIKCFPGGIYYGE